MQRKEQEHMGEQEGAGVPEGAQDGAGAQVMERGREQEHRRERTTDVVGWSLRGDKGTGAVLNRTNKPHRKAR